MWQCTTRITSKASASDCVQDINSRNIKHKRRLATSRGFGVPSSFGGVQPRTISSFITPQNSPSKFHPVAKSTTALEESHTLHVPEPSRVITTSKKQVNTGNSLPRPPSPLPGISSIGVSVISPNPYLSGNDQSLAWDNYDYSCPTNVDDLNLLTKGLNQVDLGNNFTIPIVNTSESSLSVSSFSKRMSVFTILLHSALYTVSFYKAL